MPPDVDPQILEEYCLRLHPGPVKDYMPIAWKQSMDHDWNTKVIQILASEFKKKVQACYYQALQGLPENEDDDEDLVFETIKSKLNRRRAELRAVVRRTKEAPHLTQAELEELFDRTETEKLALSRRSERRKNVRNLTYNSPP
jgi:hypothetical protein